MLSRLHALWLAAVLALACTPRKQEPPAPGAPPARDLLSHRTPYLPPQCYTKTQEPSGRVNNPCFTCHQGSLAPNYLEDADLQLTYAFPGPAQKNPWTNLFVDRREAVAKVDDAEILAYVRQGNYLAPDGTPLLAKALARVPAAWDVNRNGRWDGWVPDLHYRFDDQGFDRDAAGGYTGWRAYGYYPFPGTFWPTNGSFGDALIRLPAAFRQDAQGRFDARLYALNLSILEALVTRRDVQIPATAEPALGVDLDGDGRLATARRVKYLWVHGQGTPLQWVGAANALQREGKVHLAAGLFPEGTELAHALYYLDLVDGRPALAPRMKELRYMEKRAWLGYGAHEMAAAGELVEAQKKPDGTRRVEGNAEVGIGNRLGWRLQAFIEDGAGRLRPQTREEHGYCLGCHSGVGATDDSVFSFGRKLPASEHQGGWFHWSQRDLRGLREPLRADGEGEYAHYLVHAGAGDEFRANREVIQRFLTQGGGLRPEAARALRADISTLLLPSPSRALQLNKAYRELVREQGFIRGRDATLEPVANVHRDLRGAPEAPGTGVQTPVPGPRAAGAPVAVGGP